MINIKTQKSHQFNNKKPQKWKTEGAGKSPWARARGALLVAQAWPQGPLVLLLLRGQRAAIVLWSRTVQLGRGPLLLLGCAQLLHAPDLVQQARDEGLEEGGH